MPLDFSELRETLPERIEDFFCDLSLEHITDSDIGALLEVLLTHDVRSLNISENQITRFGSLLLAQNTFLNTLDLSCNDVGTVGTRYFMNNTVITDLSLRFNCVLDEGAADLIHANSVL